MRRHALPSLEEPRRGDTCPGCGRQREVVGYCGPCESVRDRRWNTLAEYEDRISLEDQAINELIGRGIVGRN